MFSVDEFSDPTVINFSFSVWPSGKEKTNRLNKPPETDKDYLEIHDL